MIAMPIADDDDLAATTRWRALVLAAVAWSEWAPSNGMGWQHTHTHTLVMIFWRRGWTRCQWEWATMMMVRVSSGGSGDSNWICGAK